MPRLLFTVWPFPTHLHAFVALAQEARRGGYEIAFYTGGAALETLRSEGFRCFPFREVDWGCVAHTVEDLIAGRKRPSAMRRLWPNFLVETVPAQVRDLEAMLAEWPADGIVCDIAMWAPILILRELTGIPVIAFSHVAHCILPGPDGPIHGLALPHRRNPWNNIVAAIASRAGDLVTARTRRRANALRCQFGLPPLATGVNQFTGTLPLYLVPGAPEFDNCRRDLPPSVHYVGPCLWEKYAGAASPDWLDRVRRDQPVVVVDEGALYAGEPHVLDLAARGLAGLPLTVILLAGEGRDVARLKHGPFAPNVTLHPHAPLSEVLPVADVLVTNGNSESVLVALRAGLPIVVLPSIWDQAEMAWRVAETGCGLRISPRFARPGTVRKAVRRVLEEPSFGDRAAGMGRTLALCGGPARAIELIGSAPTPTLPRPCPAHRQS